MMQEQWAKIPGFPNYEISSLGTIEKIGKTKRIPIAVKQQGSYVYASLSYAPYKTKQVNVKQIMDECFSDHIYSDHSIDDLPGEVWRDVVGWEDSYQVSNLGRVKSKKRIRAGKHDSQATVSVKIKESYVDEDGYLRVSLYYNGMSKLAAVHRLVAEAFVSNPDNLPQVNHKNGDKADNRSDNLEWVTNAQNIRHSIEAGLRDPSITSRPIECVTTGETFNSIAELHRSIGGSYNAIVHLFKESTEVTIDGQTYRYI